MNCPSWHLSRCVETCVLFYLPIIWPILTPFQYIMVWIMIEMIALNEEVWRQLSCSIKEHCQFPHVVTVLWRDSDDVVNVLSSTSAGLLKWRPVGQIRPTDHRAYLFGTLCTPIYIEIHRTMVLIWPSDTCLWTVFSPLWPTRKNNWEPLY